MDPGRRVDQTPVNREEERVGVRRVVPNIVTERMEESREFYIQVLGLEVTMDMEWILGLSSPDNPTAQINLLRRTGPSDSQDEPDITVEVADVDAVHRLAADRGLEILYPLTDEDWGVRRFFLADPNGTVVNVMSHRRGATP
jgi:catechol 2,3-dioxygenase-like lactoylglutathione lyase family enzyme